MPFHLVHGIKLVIPIECEIPTLHNVLPLLLDTIPMKQCMLHLECMNEDHHASLQKNEVHKVHTKSHFHQ